MSGQPATINISHVVGGLLLLVVGAAGTSLVDAGEENAVSAAEIVALRADIAEIKTAVRGDIATIQNAARSDIQAEAQQRMDADIRLSQRIDSAEQAQRENHAEILSVLAALRADVDVIKSRLNDP